MSDEDRIFRLPDLGEGLVDAEIAAWHVDAGDRVVPDQPLLSVETDKAIVEIPAPRAGIVAKRHGAVGERIAVGDMLVEFADAAVDAGAIVGRIQRHDAGPMAASAPGAAHAEDVGSSRAAAPQAIRGGAPARAKASPAVRRHAQMLGVDLAAVAPTGPHGTITSEDLERAALGRVEAAGAGPSEVLHGVRRAMAERMGDAHRRVVPSTVMGEVDVHGWAGDERPLRRLVRAIAQACAVEPRLNAAFDDRSWRLQPARGVDLGIAMDTDDGLFVPVLRDVGARTADAIDAEIVRLERGVQARTIDPAELHGQTITLSNFGAVAGLHATMVVVPPQVAIVGAGRIFERVVWHQGAPAVHRILPLSITIDHRVVTGAEACRFLAAMTADLERAD
jgi:pyruvate dehydrogenase E2 component (dihydrolipoamide acetyltransferase)